MIAPAEVDAAIRFARAEEAWEPVLFGGLIPIIGAAAVFWLIRYAIKSPPEDEEQKRAEELAAEQLRFGRDSREGKKEGGPADPPSH